MRRNPRRIAGSGDSLRSRLHKQFSVRNLSPPSAKMAQIDGTCPHTSDSDRDLARPPGGLQNRPADAPRAVNACCDHAADAEARCRQRPAASEAAGPLRSAAAGICQADPRGRTVPCRQRLPLSPPSDRLPKHGNHNCQRQPHDNAAGADASGKLPAAQVRAKRVCGALSTRPVRRLLSRLSST